MRAVTAMTRVAPTSLACMLLALTYASHAHGQSSPPGDAWAQWESGRGPAYRAGVETADQADSASEPASFGSSRDEPGSAAGGGDAGHADCDWVPLGPLGEVQAAYAAVNAGQLPTVEDPTYVEDIIQTPAAVAPRVISTEWFRVIGTTAEVKHNRVCNGLVTGVAFLALAPDGSGTLVVQVSAEDLVPGARDEVIRRLPAPVPRIAPADEDRDGYAFVNMRTFFWVARGPGQWDAVSATASAGGISVTVTAEPVRLRVDPGDGQPPVVCEGAPTIVTRATYHPDITGCSHVYVDSSAMAPNGETWPVTMAIVWHATWTATTGEGGDLGYVATTAPVRELPVAEIQAIITDTDN